MTVTVLSSAKRLGEVSNWKLPHLQMQKMVYFAHMFYMGKHDGKPLVEGEFQAWNLGPVHPELYQHLKGYGADQVSYRSMSGIPSIEGEAEREFLDEAVEVLSEANLVALSHRKGGAWDKNYRPGKNHIRIPNEDIMNEYEMYCSVDANP